MISPQWWLAEIDRYDNPTLVDGPHDTERGPHHAAYLMKRLGLQKGARLAVARVELFECVPDPTGANEEALSTLAAIMPNAEPQPVKQVNTDGR